jgi:ribosomal protein S18 acetylase RimI-like enzyme
LRGEPASFIHWRARGARRYIVSLGVESQLKRIQDFERKIRLGSSTAVEPFEFGTAYFNSDYPLSYAHNFLEVENAPSSISARRLADVADRIQGRAGLDHRALWVRDDELGNRLNGEFDALGWGSREHLLVMVVGRAPDRVVDTTMVEQIDYETIRPVIMEMTRREPWADSEETVAMLVDRRRLTAGATNLRHFGVRADGRIVSTTDLYSDGRTAQIEDVGTLEEFRGRGYARAVVTKALEVAKDEGHDVIWLVADDDGWPKELYRKLGFDPLDRYWEFTRPKDDSPP